MHRFAISLALVLGVALPRIPADDWPQWMGPQRDGVWSEQGILAKFPAGGPKVRWRVPVAGGYAGPAVAGGRVFVTDYVVKSGDAAPAPNKRNALQGSERVLCLDAQTGKTIWKYEYDRPYNISFPAGPRCTPTVDGDRVYTVGAEGDLVCLNATSGSKLWHRDVQKDFGVKAPIWGFCGHPLVDGDQVITVVGGDGSVIVSFDKMTGKERWRSLSSKEPGYCPPSMITAGGQRQVIVWTGEALYGLDPANGKPFWSVPLEPSYGMSIMAPRRGGDLLFAGGIGFKSVVVRLAADKPAVTEVYRGAKGNSIYPVNSTPLIEGDYLYGVDQPGHLRCIELATGKRVWETTKPTTGEKPASSGTAFLVKNGDRYFIFAESGDLIIAKLTPAGYEELDRWKMLEPTGDAFGRSVVWSHPAFADKCVFARNDKEIVCVSLAE